MRRSKCEKCNAPLNVPHGATSVVCLFCKSENAIASARPSRRPAVVHDFEAGEPVMVRWNGRYWPAIVQAPASDGTFHIRYEGCSDNWDEVVERPRIRTRTAAELAPHEHRAVPRSRGPLYATMAGVVAVAGTALLLLMASSTPSTSSARTETVEPAYAPPSAAESPPANPLEANTVVVPLARDTPLDLCLSVEVRWGRDWWKSTIVGENPDGTVRVHYLGWSDAFDENVPRDRIRVRIPRDAAR